jgi:hypothetical protein
MGIYHTRGHEDVLGRETEVQNEWIVEVRGSTLTTSVEANIGDSFCHSNISKFLFLVNISCYSFHIFYLFLQKLVCKSGRLCQV